MTILGIILVIVGLGAAALLFTGSAPMFLASLPIPVLAWVAVGAVGGLLVMLNRRPGD